MVLLARSRLNKTKFLISKALIESVISRDKFLLIMNVVEECNKMKEEINSNLKK